MDEKLGQIEELWETLLDLTGDIIALEAYCLNEDRCVSDSSAGMCRAYLRRIGNYTTQHLTDIQHLTKALLNSSAERLST